MSKVANEVSTREKLFSAVKMFNIIQETRIALNNRLGALDVSEEDIRILDVIYTAIKDTENKFKKVITKLVENEPIYTEFLSRVKGTGALISAKLISFIKDIERFPNVAKLWRYAGLGVIDGKAEKKTRGQQLSYNPRFKAFMYNVGVSMLRKNSKYRIIYDKAKQYYTENRDWDKGHIHLAALRKMEKLFLSHVWAVWRELEGLPVRDPYPIEYLGHTTILKPEDFIDN